jgi:phosphate transport system ATP-binding protein
MMKADLTAPGASTASEVAAKQKGKLAFATAAITPALDKVKANNTPSSEMAFDVDRLSGWFGNHQALFDLDLKIQAKAVTAIIGPSGCGKSTFLRCLNRMHELVRGARLDGLILLFGEDVYALHIDPTLVRRRVGMVFQKSNPFPTMTIGENVTVGLRLNGVRSRSVLNEHMEKALRMAALWDEVKDHLDRPGTSLSGGQQQRLCIARALAVQPEVLLMDEPASALDPIATMKIEELIQVLKRDYTIVIVTHNMQQAARVSEFTAFMYLGELIEFDSTSKMFTAPHDQRTQDYITGRFG